LDENTSAKEGVKGVLPNLNFPSSKLNRSFDRRPAKSEKDFGLLLLLLLLAP